MPAWNESAASRLPDAVRTGLPCPRHLLTIQAFGVSRHIVDCRWHRVMAGA